MWHLRHIVLAAVAVVLVVAPVASAHDPHPDRGGAVVAPAKDKWAGESWAQIYSLPISENPFFGNGNPCLTLANYFFPRTPTLDAHPDRPLACPNSAALNLQKACATKGARSMWLIVIRLV